MATDSYGDYFEVIEEGMALSGAHLTAGSTKSKQYPHGRYTNAGKLSPHNPEFKRGAIDLQIPGKGGEAHKKLANYYNLAGFRAKAESPNDPMSRAKGWHVHVEFRPQSQEFLPAVISPRAATLGKEPRKATKTKPLPWENAPGGVSGGGPNPERKQHTPTIAQKIEQMPWNQPQRPGFLGQPNPAAVNPLPISPGARELQRETAPERYKKALEFEQAQEPSAAERLGQVASGVGRGIVSIIPSAIEGLTRLGQGAATVADYLDVPGAEKVAQTLGRAGDAIGQAREWLLKSASGDEEINATWAFVNEMTPATSGEVVSLLVGSKAATLTEKAVIKALPELAGKSRVVQGLVKLGRSATKDLSPQARTVLGKALMNAGPGNVAFTLSTGGISGDAGQDIKTLIEGGVMFGGLGTLHGLAATQVRGRPKVSPQMREAIAAEEVAATKAKIDAAIKAEASPARGMEAEANAQAAARAASVSNAADFGKPAQPEVLPAPEVAEAAMTRRKIEAAQAAEKTPEQIMQEQDIADLAAMRTGAPKAKPEAQTVAANPPVSAPEAAQTPKVGVSPLKPLTTPKTGAEGVKPPAESGAEIKEPAATKVEAPKAKEPWEKKETHNPANGAASLYEKELPESFQAAWTKTAEEFETPTLENVAAGWNEWQRSGVKPRAYGQGREAFTRIDDILQNWRDYPSDARALHRKIIEQALASGKPVPPEVLADYPDLAKPKPAKPVAPGSESFSLERQSRKNAEELLAGKSETTIREVMDQAGFSTSTKTPVTTGRQIADALKAAGYELEGSRSAKLTPEGKYPILDMKVRKAQVNAAKPPPITPAEAIADGRARVAELRDRLKTETGEAKAATERELVRAIDELAKLRGQKKAEAPTLGKPKAEPPTLGKPAKSKPEAAEVTPESPGYGEGNAIVSKDRAEAARKRIQEKQSRLSAGIDPTLIADYIELGVYHLEAGLRKLPAWSAGMVKEFGDDIKPHLALLWDRVNDRYSGRKYAGSINLNRLDTTEQVKGAIETAVKDLAGEVKTWRRGTQHWAETVAKTEKVGLSFKRTPEGKFKLFISGKEATPGKAYAVEEAEALRMFHEGLWEEVGEAAKSFHANPTPKAELIYHEAKQKALVGLLAESGSATELGRAMGIRRRIAASLHKEGRVNLLRPEAPRPEARPEEVTVSAAKRLLKELGEGEELDAALAELAGVPPDNPGAIAQIVLRHTKPRQHWIHSYHLANLLSGIRGTMRDILGTGFWQGYNELLIRPLSILTPAARRAEAGTRPVMAEVIPAWQGALVGARSGLDRAAEVLRDGYTVEQAVRLDLYPELGGGLKNPWNWAPRIRSAINEWQRSIAYGAELYAQAARKAYGDGARGNRLSQRIQQLAENPTDEMLAAAETHGEKLTYTTGPGESTVLQAIYGIQRMGKIGTKRGTIYPMKVVMPFVRTAHWIVRSGFESSPAGFLRYLDPKIRANPAEAARVAAHATAGTLAMATIYPLAKAGLITGPAPQEAKERRLFYAAGKQAYSIKVGKRWISYRDVAGGFQMILSAVVGFAQAREDKQPTHMAIGRAALQAVRSGFDLSMLRGIRDLDQAIREPKGYFNRWASGTVSGFIPGISLQRNIAGAIDPTMRDAQGFVDLMKTSIPGLSLTVDPRLSPFGEGQKYGGGGIFSLAPISVTEESKDPVIQELVRLGVYPGFVGDSLSISGEKTKLTPKQKREYQEKAGAEMYRALADLIASDDYKGMDDDDKADELAREWNAARADVRGTLKAEWGDTESPVLGRRRRRRRPSRE